MKTKLGRMVLICLALLSGCAIRAVAIIETEEAVAGKSVYHREQGALVRQESILGAVFGEYGTDETVNTNIEKE